MAKLIVGIDEAGRGPWAGPLVAAAVALPVNCRIQGVKDSKLLARNKRVEIALKIRQRAVGIGIGWSSHIYIDRFGLTQACRRAMLIALHQLSVPTNEIIIDGSFNFLAKTHSQARTIVKADQSHLCVSAASIIAKVARDNYMAQVAKLYPQYGFEQHVGYGTKLHQQRIQLHGLSAVHRQSFQPNILTQLDLVEAA